jgi:hypothetical protein
VEQRERLIQQVHPVHCRRLPEVTCLHGQSPPLIEPRFRRTRRQSPPAAHFMLPGTAPSRVVRAPRRAVSPSPAPDHRLPSLKPARFPGPARPRKPRNVMPCGPAHCRHTRSYPRLALIPIGRHGYP